MTKMLSALQLRSRKMDAQSVINWTAVCSESVAGPEHCFCWHFAVDGILEFGINIPTTNVTSLSISDRTDSGGTGRQHEC